MCTAPPGTSRAATTRPCGRPPVVRGAAGVAPHDTVGCRVTPPHLPWERAVLEKLRQKKADKTFASVAEILLHRVLDTPGDTAFSYPDKTETWVEVTWKEVHEVVRQATAGLRELGVGLEDRVAILALTRIEWILADLAIMCAGGACTTIYPSNTAEECHYILSDSGSKIVFAEDKEQLDKLLAIRDRLPGVEKVVTFDGKGSADGWIITWTELCELGKAKDAAAPDAFVERIESIKREHLATLIYTSGTTGVPKGVELLQDCWVYISEAMDEVDIFQPDDKQFLWLPMSHSFGKVLEVILISANIHTAVDGRIPRIIDNLAVVQPTWMAAAPRIFEKAYNKIVTGVEKDGGLKEKIFRWALSVGSEVSKVRQAYKEPSGLLALKFRIADALVFKKVKERFGGRVRFFISGSAPLSKDMAEFFHACGILILEGYGLTESSAASFVNRPESFKFGTVGPGVPGTVVKIDPETGEILFKSRGVMRGYWGLPDKTAETLEDGWLHTGDKGELDDQGRLRITGRIKELIKTSGGKYVAPNALESRLKALCPYLSQVLVHGDARNFCVALVTLDPEAIPVWAADHGLGGKSYTELTKEPAVQAMVQEAVDKLNGELPSYSTVKYFSILPNDLTVEDGDLTASLKVKRKHVEDKFKELLDSFYTGSVKKL
ncbi:MAG: AMP-binding protein [Alphaproteobacteria bacterium]|nr:AMP-binding protein [Alphaproteobacteria bacterium]